MSDRDLPVVVRPVHPDDVEAVGALTVQAYVTGGGVDPASAYVDLLARADRRATETTLLVAERGGRVVGSVSLCPYGSEWAEISRPGEAEMRMLAVATTAWGTGVADALVRAAVDRFRDDGHTGVVISVIDGNEAAHRLYARHGFVRAPERDWDPTPEAHLLAYTLPLRRPA